MICKVVWQIGVSSLTNNHKLSIDTCCREHTPVNIQVEFWPGIKCVYLNCSLLIRMRAVWINVFCQPGSQNSGLSYWCTQVMFQPHCLIFIHLHICRKMLAMYAVVKESSAASVAGWVEHKSTVTGSDFDDYFSWYDPLTYGWIGPIEDISYYCETSFMAEANWDCVPLSHDNAWQLQTMVCLL